MSPQLPTHYGTDLRNLLRRVIFAPGPISLDNHKDFAMSNITTSAAAANVIAFAADADLSPESMIMELDGKPEQMLNADAVIALMRRGDTPEARAMYRSYRKVKTRLKRQFPDLEDAGLRDRAVLDALRDAGFRITNLQ